VERGRASHAITPSADPKRGRAIYERENCSTCHAIAGTGNPRTPLDGVGKRLNDEELKAWITGAVVAVDGLSPSIVKRKQRYRELPESDLADVVAYLSHLEE
jgi:mono/diheme cytochrome c family protein